MSYTDIQRALPMQIEDFSPHQSLSRSLKLISEQWGKESTVQPLPSEEWDVQHLSQERPVSGTR